MNSISGKLLLRILAASAIGLLIAILAVVSINSSQRQAAANNLLEDLQFIANNKIEEKKQSTLGFLVGVLPQLVDAIEAGDQQELYQQTQQINRDFADRTPFKNIELIATDANNRVLVRSFASQPDSMVGEVINSDFSSLLNGSEKSYTELELTPSGLFVIARVAAKHQTGPAFGVLQMRAGLRSVVAELSNQDVYYNMVLNDKGLRIWPNASNNPKTDGLPQAHRNWFATSNDWYRDISLDKAIKNGFAIEGNKAISTHPIEYQGEVVGYKIVGVDMSYPGLVAAFENVNKLVVIMLILFVLTLMVIMLITWFNIRQVVSRPLATMQKLVEQVSQTGKLNANFSSQANDEVGKMSQALSLLFKNISDAIRETNTTVAGLAAGDFTNRINGSYQGDLLDLKTNINQSADNITDTITQISHLMMAFREGDFHQDIQINAQGEYKTLLQNSQGTADTLFNLINQINEIMAQAARGYFDARITADARGNMLLLKDHINHTLDSLEKAINETANVMIAQGTGDLTQRINLDLHGTLSILKEGVNNATANVSSMLAQSNFSVVKLSEGTINIARGIQDLAGRTQSQAASLQETAASMEQITAMIRQTADNAKEANRLSERSHQSAMEANRVVEDTIKVIEEINESSSKISDITALIDSIAFQTNLLALNAAVEAARAGEHGRGFAVVAGEVRSLAQKSADAARDIRVLIDDTVNKVHQGAEMASQSGKALQVINESINSVTSIVQEISKATNEQAIGVEQVNTAVAAIDTATQQNAALVDETAQQTDRMSEDANQVIELSKTFKIDLNQIGFTTAMETGVFNFAQARRAHRQWKGTVSAYVAGMDVDFNREVAFNHTKCQLGKWYLGNEGQQYAHLPEMQEMDKYHAQLHETIRKIIEASEAGDIATQEKEFKRLDELSAIVVQKLSEAETAAARMTQTATTRSGSGAVQPQIAAAPKTTAKPASPKPALQAPKATTSQKTHGDDAEEWAEF